MGRPKKSYENKYKYSRMIQRICQIQAESKGDTNTFFVITALNLENENDRLYLKGLIDNIKDICSNALKELK